MGHQYTVTNVRGISAETSIPTQEGDDTFFVSSDACEDNTTTDSVEALFQLLDYVNRDLAFISQEGCHRLMIPDNPGIPNLFARSQTQAKGLASRRYAELTTSSLENLADDVGNIFLQLQRLQVIGLMGLLFS